MITAIHHIAIISSSEKSIIFYSQLGFIESFRKIRAKDTIVLMDGYGIQLEIFIDSKHPNYSEIEPIGFRHLALKVDNIERTIEELKLPLSDIGEIMNDWTGIKFCFIKDPDGLVIELHE